MNGTLFKETLFAGISVSLIVMAFILEALIGETMVVITLFGVAFLIGGYHKAVIGIQDTKEEKRLNVEFLMILAALSAFIIGNYSEGAILILIFSISGVLESYANAKSEKALKSLLGLAPEKAVLYDADNNEKEVSLQTVEQDDILIVKVGQKVPVDGVITQGSTAVDQAAITGEFVPAYKHVGDKVFAGAINLEGSFLMRASKNAKDSVIQKIVAFVESAQQDQPKVETKIKKFERYYVYAVILLALMFMIIPPIFNLLTQSEAFYRGIIVLVVGSPCALVASVSPAVLSALSNGSKNHILIKGGSRLEGLNEIKAVLFDKTGTITSGTPKVVQIVHEANDEKYLMDVIYTLERQSNHPLAKAVCQHLNDAEVIDKITTQEKPGFGMEGTIDDTVWKVGRFEASTSSKINEALKSSMQEGLSCVFIVKDDQMIGFIALEDTIREPVKGMIKTLKSQGIKPIMMTGDNENTAKNLATTIGIEEVFSECYPEDKVDILKKTQDKYGKVLMIGDGVNDAPALSMADVAIAMGTGTDVSLETSDIVFINDDLNSLKRVFSLAKKLRNIVKMNIVFSVSVIVFLMVGNLFGQINLPFGVLVHELSTVLVVLNSLRLLIR